VSGLQHDRTAAESARLRVDREEDRPVTRDPNYTPFAPEPGPRIPQSGELLYEFLKGHTRVRFELIDHGPVYGVEARILHNEEHHMSHTVAPWHTVPFATPRAAAIAWAEQERKHIEKGGAIGS
jgi:hypothetical protein